MRYINYEWGIQQPFLAKGLFTGLVIAVPVGPISILCIQRSIRQGCIAGLVSGLGASTGDAFYALISSFGLGFIAADFSARQGWLSFLGGLFLLYLGIKTFFDRPKFGMIQRIRSSPNLITSTPQHHVDWHQLFENYITVFALDVINPMTVLPFIAVLSGLYADNVSGSPVYGVLFTLGVFASGLVWRSLLSLVADWLRNHINVRQLCWINWVAGTSIIVFGLSYIYSTGSLP